MISSPKVNIDSKILWENYNEYTKMFSESVFSHDLKYNDNYDKKETYDKEKEYLFAMETGMLNTYYMGITAGFSKKQISDICFYEPNSVLFKLMHLLFANKPAKKLLRLSYLTTKWFYKRKLHFPY